MRSVSIRTAIIPRITYPSSATCMRGGAKKTRRASAIAIEPGTTTRVGGFTGDSLFQRLSRDDELHALAGPLIALGVLRAPIVALGREIVQMAVPAEDLHAVAARLDRGVAREELRLRRGEDVVLSRILHGRRSPCQQTGGVDLRRHVGEHPLDRLEVGDLFSEGLALLGVRKGVLEAGARDSDRLRRDRDAATVEGRERDLVALAHLAAEGRG